MLTVVCERDPLKDMSEVEIFSLQHWMVGWWDGCSSFSSTQNPSGLLTPKQARFFTAIGSPKTRVFSLVATCGRNFRLRDCNPCSISIGVAPHGTSHLVCRHERCVSDGGLVFDIARKVVAADLPPWVLTEPEQMPHFLRNKVVL